MKTIMRTSQGKTVNLSRVTRGDISDAIFTMMKQPLDGYDLDRICKIIKEFLSFGWDFKTAEFCAYFDVIEHKLTNTTHSKPTQESAVWSSWEGGQTHNDKPDMWKLIGWEVA